LVNDHLLTTLRWRDFQCVGLTATSTCLVLSKRSRVAAASVFFVGTRFPALIGLQQMSIAVGAAAEVASVNRRTS
jgi:hypothetical protein